MLSFLRKIATGGRHQQTDQQIVNRLINYQGNADLLRLTLPPMGYLPPDVAGTSEICDRLIKAYRLAIEQGGPPPDGLWKTKSVTCHQQLATSLQRGEHNNVAHILAEMFRNPVTSGLALGRETYLNIRTNDYQARLDWHDKMIALAQACGVISAQNPEQGQYGTLLASDSLDILRRTAMFLGIDPAPPQIGGLFGISYNGKIIPVNHLLHLYTVNRLNTLVQLERADCLEIGGGVGFLAYAASLRGARTFSIVDLPLVNVLQGYLLCRSDLSSAVQLFGEEREVINPRIRVLPNHCIDQMPEKGYDIVINQDSLPEMGEETMLHYLRTLPGLSRKYFLSINQEAQAPIGVATRQGWVHEACRTVPALHLMYRVPYWLRKGYVEELYLIND